MEIDYLQNLIKEGEHQKLDFKFRIDDQKKIARTICAFANSEGGTLLIGVKDNGKIVGIDPEEEFHMIQAAAEMYCAPPVAFTSQIWQEDRHYVLIIHINQSTTKPHKALSEDGEYKAYVRIEDETLMANKVITGSWKLQPKIENRPQKFTPDVMTILKAIDLNEKMSLGKMYRSLDLPKNFIDQTLMRLLIWNIISYDQEEKQLVFKLNDLEILNEN